MKEEVLTVLGSQASSFIFVEGKEIVVKGANEKRFSSKTGLVGRVVEEKRSMIFYDCKKQPDFHDAVDVASILPTYYHPIMSKSDDKVLAVLAFVMRQKKKPSQLAINSEIVHDEGLLSLDAEFVSFCNHVAAAFRLLFHSGRDDHHHNPSSN